MVASSAPRDASPKIPPGPEGSNGIGRCGRRGKSAGPPPFQATPSTSFAFRMEPAGIPAGVALVLPDRHALLHLVDDPAARGERGVAVRGGRSDPHRELPDGQGAHAMHAGRVDDVEARARLLEDAVALGFGKRDVRFIEEAVHRPALVVVADPALEAGV